MHDVEPIVERCLRDVLGPERARGGCDLRRRLAEDWGLSSMQLVMLVTTVCEEAGLPLTAFTERDIRSIKTAYDLIGVVRRAKSSEVQRVEPTA